jgi:hypothetical protein
MVIRNNSAKTSNLTQVIIKLAILLLFLLRINLVFDPFPAFVGLFDPSFKKKTEFQRLYLSPLFDFSFVVLLLIIPRSQLLITPF